MNDQHHLQARLAKGFEAGALALDFLSAQGFRVVASQSGHAWLIVQ
ncbi:hypothetical protein [Candidatus Accumulibacter contiguus]|nr:hypothetical protein [Candidatus Accumulibacter contiguus]